MVAMEGYGEPILQDLADQYDTLGEMADRVGPNATLEDVAESAIPSRTLVDEVIARYDSLTTGPFTDYERKLADLYVSIQKLKDHRG